jgi:hypothetical protein
MKKFRKTFKNEQQIYNLSIRMKRFKNTSLYFSRIKLNFPIDPGSEKKRNKKINSLRTFSYPTEVSILTRF